MIDSKSLDARFKDLLASEPGGEHIKRCYACGTCTAGCPVREVTDRYNPRRIIRMVLLGLRKEVLSDSFIWLCSSCYTCLERCPQDVRIPELMTALRNIAVREGYLPSAMKAQLGMLASHGRLLEITDFENEKRMEAGLPPLTEDREGIRTLFEELEIPHGP